MSCPVCAGYSSYKCPCCGGTVAVRTCPDCGGRGHQGYFALDIETRADVEVEEAIYNILPDNEDMAASMGWRFCKQETEPCATCDGTGELVDG